MGCRDLDILEIGVLKHGLNVFHGRNKILNVVVALEDLVAHCNVFDIGDRIEGGNVGVNPSVCCVLAGGYFLQSVSFDSHDYIDSGILKSFQYI